VFYSSTAGLTQISQLTEWQVADKGSGLYTATNSTTVLLPVGVLYFYIGARGDADGSIIGGVIGNATPATIPNYQPPSSFTWAYASAGAVDITRVTGSAENMPTDVYFGPAGATSVASLTYYHSEFTRINYTMTFSKSWPSGLENGRVGTGIPWGDSSKRLYIFCAGVLVSNSNPLT
jgi:hypothetical protein